MNRRRILVTSAVALLQRAAPPRPRGRAHPERHLGALPADARPRRATTCAPKTRTARRSMLQAEARGPPARRVDRADATPSTSETSSVSASASTSTTPRTPRRTVSWSRGSTSACSAGGHLSWRPVRQFYDPERRDVPARPLREGQVPALRHAGSERRQLRGLRGHLYARDLIDPVSVDLGRTPGRAAPPSICFVALRDLEPALLRDWISSGRLQTEIVNKLDGVARRAARATGTSRATAPYFGFEIPDAPGQVLLRLVRRADRLHGRASRSSAPSAGCDFDDFWAPEAEGSTEVYHFIGKDIPYFHCLFWPAMLAGERVSVAHRSSGARLPDRRRREDVEVARHVRHGARLSRSARRRTRCATTTRRSSPAGSATSTSTSRTSSSASTRTWSESW